MIAIIPSPKTLSLIKWKDEQGQEQTFHLIDRVSAKWTEFGTLLDLTPNQLAVLKQESSGNIALCWKKVMEHWLSGGGKGDYPATWEGLYSLLEDVQCSGVANKLKKAVTRSHVPTYKETADISTPNTPSMQREFTEQSSCCQIL